MTDSLNPQRVKLGARLRNQREARSLTIADVTRVTKIPERSVVLLETGDFDGLPGEVFARGFLRSYCRCVGLEPEALVRDYDELIVKPASMPGPSLARPSLRRAAQSEPEDAAAASSAEPAALSPEEVERNEESRLFAALSAAGRGTSRLSLTLAVIILVIVATLTLSLLLRRPGHAADRLSAANSLRCLT